MRPRQRVPSWPLGILLVLVQGILCLAMLPVGRGHASATFACLGHGYSWPGCQLDLLLAGPGPVLTPVGGLHDCPCPGVPGGQPASKLGMALLARAGSAPHQCSSALCTASMGHAWLGGGGPCTSWISFTCYAALFPQGKFRTLLAVENQPALSNEPTPDPGVLVKHRPVVFAASLPLCAHPFLGIVVLLYAGPSFLHWALDFPTGLVVSEPGISTRRETRGR